MSDQANKVKKHMDELLRVVQALQRAVCHHLDTNENAKNQVSSAASSLASWVGQGTQQLAVAEASADTLKAAIKDVRTAEAEAAALCQRVMQQVGSIQDIMQYPKVQEDIAESKLSSPTGLGVQNGEKIIKYLSLYEEALCKLLPTETRVKKLITSLQTDTNLLIALVAEPEKLKDFELVMIQKAVSRELEALKRKMDTLSQASAERVSEHSILDDIERKVIKEAEDVLPAPGAQRSHYIKFPEGSEQVLNKAKQRFLQLCDSAADICKSASRFIESHKYLLSRKAALDKELARRRSSRGQIRA